MSTNEYKAFKKTRSSFKVISFFVMFSLAQFFLSTVSPQSVCTANHTSEGKSIIIFGTSLDVG